jgi:chloramphenicol 3-O phosphotransferase
MVILLNGTSSSGKTSIANELLKLSKDPYFFFSVDQFLEPAMPKTINMDIEEDLRKIDRAISGFNHALRAYAGSVDFMIVDHVLQKRIWLNEVATALKDSEVFFIGVLAPLKILEQRESARIDRQPGTARAQFDLINSYQYDLAIETDKLGPTEAAAKILSHVKSGTGLQKSASAR